MAKETSKRLFRVDRREISYIRYTLESYDGMAAVTTLDPREAFISVSVAPGCEAQVAELIASLKTGEGLLIEELDALKTPDAAGEDRPAQSSLRQQIAVLGKGGFHIVTMGCQMNVYDSDTAARMLMRAGWEPVTDPRKARLVLINTCSVREKPEHKAVSMLGRMASLKNRRPDMILGIMGCFAQQRGAELLRRFPALNLVMGPRALGSFPSLLARLEEDPAEPLVAIGTSDFPLDPEPEDGFFKGRVSGFIAVMQGCDNFCTYCIVPYVRGRERSRDPSDIIAEADALLSEGVKELTLLGQNVNSYRWETGRIRQFPDLLRAVAEREGLLRLRFTTSHPKDLSDDLIACFGNLPTLCPHIHLPFQSGSDRILKRMGRRYSREDYLRLVEKLRGAQPSIALTSDVMVGFPGETEEDFAQTLDLIERIQFDNLYSFKYSDRPGTAAADMDRKIQEAEKAARLETLQRIQETITLRRNQALIGSVVEVLVEGESRRGRQFSGRTGCNKVVNFNHNKNCLGKIINVLVKESFIHSLRGEALE